VYPNPFNPNTTVKFGILSPNHTTIEIYNTRGQIIRTLTNQHYLPGEYTVTWDGKDNLGKACSSGVYSMQMVSGKTVSSRKLVLMK
jgi:flagellar hook assembly protein FlgD